jgi:FtsP/CotA-like multicopper oxidase with cupredoxin domain
VAQPFFEVERKKYRFRFLNASNARIYHLRLSTGEPFIQIGQDTWEFPEAISIESFDLWMAQRVDCIIDFRDAPEVVYLENIMEQTDGRKPEGVNPDNPTPLVEFRVSGTSMNNISVEPGTAIRGPFIPITEDEICATRTFEFVRRNGAWQINNMFFSPRRSDVVPLQNSAERWIFINKSGGWVHPIHIHLEAHQIQKFNGKTPPPSLRFNVDLSPLEEGGTSEFFIKFRTFTGPFVFHCHNLEHEDMRMMHAFDPRPAGMESLNNGVRPHNSTDFVDEYGFTAEQITGMPIVPPDNTLLFDNEGDVDRLEGRGVGIPEDDFEPGGETMPPVK